MKPSQLNIEFNGFEQSAATLEQQAKELAERLKKYMVNRWMNSPYCLVGTAFWAALGMAEYRPAS